MKIIPAIDIIDGKCVRLSKGDYTTKKIYDTNPLEVAKNFEAHGIEYLHLVDLEGAKLGRIIHYNVLESIAKNTELKIDFGGGLTTNKNVEIAFECGANQITVGSMAVKKPELFISWLAKYTAEKIILGADCLDRKIAMDGWVSLSKIDIVDFIKLFQKNGIKYVICTDIDKDGMLAGASKDLYREIIQKTQIKLIASGGIANLTDVNQLKEIDCYGVIIGKAIYEGKITLKQLQNLY